jgi:hypothetical protein
MPKLSSSSSSSSSSSLSLAKLWPFRNPIRKIVWSYFLEGFRVKLKPFKIGLKERETKKGKNKD